MKLAVLKERRDGERRVAATPETVKKYRGLGLEVVIEAGAGDGLYGRADFEAAGATFAVDAGTALENAGIVLTVQRPEAYVLGQIPSGAALAGLLNPTTNPQELATPGFTVFAMEFVPRISRAQSMDALSSQSSLAGYRAVIDAASELNSAFPLMMTAAGTIAPAKVFVLGAGVAGLQAIATARRLGAVVQATDVRAAAAEQVESLGAKFLAPPAMEDAETTGGYARKLDEEQEERQAEIISKALTKTNVAICTALIPGRTAPVLITEDMVRDMKPGSVIVDLAVEQGGNCALSRPGEVVVAHGVRIVGHLNVTSRIAADASSQYARNLFSFMAPLLQDGKLNIDWNDEIIRGSLIARGGKLMHPELIK